MPRTGFTVAPKGANKRQRSVRHRPDVLELQPRHRARHGSWQNLAWSRRRVDGSKWDNTSSQTLGSFAGGRTGRNHAASSFVTFEIECA